MKRKCNNCGIEWEEDPSNAAKFNINVCPSCGHKLWINMDAFRKEMNAEDRMHNEVIKHMERKTR